METTGFQPSECVKIVSTSSATECSCANAESRVPPSGDDVPGPNICRPANERRHHRRCSRDRVLTRASLGPIFLTGATGLPHCRGGADKESAERGLAPSRTSEVFHLLRCNEAWCLSPFCRRANRVVVVRRKKGQAPCGTVSRNSSIHSARSQSPGMSCSRLVVRATGSPFLTRLGSIQRSRCLAPSIPFVKDSRILDRPTIARLW